MQILLCQKFERDLAGSITKHLAHASEPSFNLCYSKRLPGRVLTLQSPSLYQGVVH